MVQLGQEVRPLLSISGRLRVAAAASDSGPAARAGLIQVSLAGVLWGTGGLAVQLIRRIEPLSVVTISAYRMLIAAVVLVLAVAVTGASPAVRELLRRHPVRAVAVGVGTGAYQLLYFFSVIYVGVSVSTVVSLGVAPVLLTAGESVHARRWPRPRTVLVLLAAVVGLVLVSTYAGSGSGGSRPGLGIIAALGSGSLYALTTALGRTVAQRATPLALTTVATSAGALFLVPCALIGVGLGPGRLIPVHGTVWLWLLYLGLCTMAVAYALLYAGLRHTSASAATIASLLEPVTAAAAARIVLAERLGALGIVGAALILVAIAAAGG